MNFNLTEKQIALQQLARDFAQREIRPMAAEMDRRPDPKDRIPLEVLEKASRIGLRTLALKEELGGGGADMVTTSIVGEELGWGDLGIAITLDQDWKVTRLFNGAMTNEQRDRYLPAFIEDNQFHLGIATNEPNSGSDNMIPYNSPGAGLRTSAVRDGEHWVINGMKHFIMNGGIAKLYMANTRTDPTVGVVQGTTYFIVTSDMEGFSLGRLHDKMGMRLGQNAEIIFENLRVPDANRLSEVNGSGKWRLPHFRGTNAESSAPLLGTARAAYEAAVEYAKTRIQGGKPIIEHQGVGFKLADCYMDYEAARRFLHYACWQAEQEELYDPKTNSMAKVFLAEACFRIATRALEVWGGTGYMTEAPMEKYLRDVTSWFHTEGTNEVHRIRSMAIL